MLVKVCGIKTPGNIEMIQTLDIDLVGLNFYAPSVRFISSDINSQLFKSLPNSIGKVGVFVNESISTIKAKAIEYKLDYIQLHGDEDESFCKAISDYFKIIKVFRIDDKFDFGTTSNYEFSSFFLFDTASPKFGGSGKKFNWNNLSEYCGEVPFILSGGIGPDDLENVQSISHSKFVGIDINSKFESAPGIKNKSLLESFINGIKNKEEQ